MLSSVNLGDQIMDQSGGPIGTVTTVPATYDPYTPSQCLCDVIVSGNPANVRHGVLYNLARCILIQAAA
jgi:hypothetical protein